MKICRICKQEKPLQDFYKRKDYADGHRTECKKCTCYEHSKNRKANKERYHLVDKNSALKRDFDMSLKEYIKRLQEQDMRCYLCKIPQVVLKKALAVDHCHSTNRIRKLLCDKCNRGLGYFKDNPEVLSRAVEYVKAGW